MKSLALFLLIFIPVSLFSQSHQYWEWAKSFGGPGADLTSDIKIKNGYLYITGTFTSSTITWENTTLTNNGGKDIFVAKLDTNGNTIWVKNFGGLADDTVRQLEINNNGIFVLLCQSASNTINIGPTQLSNPKNFYVKFDADGNLIKGQVLPDTLIYNDIDIDADGGVYAASIFSHHAFTFANTYVDTLPRLAPPAGSPDPNSVMAVYAAYNSGAALLKYDAAGNESWVKALYSLPAATFYVSLPLVFHPTAFLIEFDNANNTLIAVLNHWGAIDIDSVYYADDPHNYKATVFLAGFSPSSGLKYYNLNIGSGEQLFVRGLEIGEAGPVFHSGRNWQHYNHENEQWTSAISNGRTSRSITNFSPLQAGDKGRIILRDNDINNTIISILDSSFILQDTMHIPGGEYLTKSSISMADKALFFGDHFTASPLLIQNNNHLALPLINLPNQGLNDIFIGKFHSLGYMPLAFNSFADTFQFCYGISNINLDSSIIKFNGAGNPTYHWEPAANFEDANRLNTRVLMTADTIIAILTVKDAAGDSISKRIVFINGIQPDLHLKLLDTVACSNGFINITLEGTQFINCYAQGLCDLHIASRFDSLNQVNQMWSGDCPNVNHYRLLSNVPGYCLDTTSIKLTIYPAFQAFNIVQVCSGSSYTIPNDTTYTNITQYIRRTRSLLTARGCDSTTITDLVILSPSNRTENATICQGNNYTFPDSIVVQNIQTNMNHVSTLKAAGGCDSIYVYTYITVTPSYTQTESSTVCPGSNYTFPDNTILTNIQNDTSHISHFTSVSGCDSNIVTHIAVLPPSLETENVNVCGGSNYTFPDAFVVTNIQANITHASRISTTSGCDSIVTTNLHVVILDTSITKARATLQANLNDGVYQWLDCTSNTNIAGETHQSFIATMIGNYAVQLLKDGCIDTSACYAVAFDDLLRIHGSPATIYPVPASSILTIEFISDRQSILQSSFFDGAGRVVLSNQTNLITGVNRITLNVAGLQRGLYTIVLFSTATQEKIFKKIIIN